MKLRFLILFVLFFTGLVAQAADFTLRGVDGKLHHLSDYRGKWVVVNYWATWCPPCRAEIPDLIQFYNQHKNKDAVVLGVNYEKKTAAQLKPFLSDFHISYPVLLGEPGSGKNIGPVPGLPTTYVVSPKGEVVARQIGSVTAEILNDFLAKQAKH